MYAHKIPSNVGLPANLLDLISSIRLSLSLIKPDLVSRLSPGSDYRIQSFNLLMDQLSLLPKKANNVVQLVTVRDVDIIDVCSDSLQNFSYSINSSSDRDFFLKIVSIVAELSVLVQLLKVHFKFD